MSDIKFDRRNYRKHDDKNKDLIKKSLVECGAGRSIVIDADNEIIAGNGIYEQAQNLNIPIKIIETAGDELVVVKRTDLKYDDEKRKKLAVLDNSSSDSSEFDLGLLAEDFKIDELGSFGIDFVSDKEEAGFPKLATDDKAPFQQMTFKFSAEQAQKIEEALKKAKLSPNFEFVDNGGNENSNGNALFMIVEEWFNNGN